MKRGNETVDHTQGKLMLARALRSLGFDVLFEHLLADVVACRLRRGRYDVVSAEYDRTLRNAVPNVRRDLERGARSVLTLVPDRRVLCALRRSLKRHLPRSAWTRVGIVTVAQLNHVLNRMQQPSSPPGPLYNSNNPF